MPIGGRSNGHHGAVETMNGLAGSTRAMNLHGGKHQHHHQHSSKSESSSSSGHQQQQQQAPGLTRMHYSSSESSLDAAFFRPSSALELPMLDLTDAKKKAQVIELTKPFFLSDDDAERIKKALISEIEQGLAKPPDNAKSSLQMENTFIPELPDGTEDGDYLALDLGGTNFRVILLRMKNGEVESEKVKYFHVPEAVRLGNGERLFDFLATCILEFVTKENISREQIPLGFCFSFPMHQESLNIGILAAWSKSFNCPGVVGQDVVKMLNTALKKRGIHVDVVAVLNDTTGTLIAGAQKDPNCAVGLIVGTGCNACYLESAERIPKWEGDHADAEEVIVDIEWGRFGDNGCLDFLKTEVDKDVDRESLLAGVSTFEKYMSGKYLGEIVRNVMIRMARGSGSFFGDHASQRLLQFGSVSAKQVSMIEDETITGGTVKSKEVLNDLDLIYDRDDVKALQYVCAVVSFRAAQLVSICVATLLERMGKPNVTIAVDGSVYKLHPRLKYLLKHYTAEYVDPKFRFKYVLTEDGSGKGAGMVAAIAKRMQEREKGAN